MATNKTPTTLGNLEHGQIKQSLTEFLRNQSIFSGYNFEGSAIQTLIDLLAYNTFYYAYYANMINAEAFLDSAQREESMISLTKPLGYTVPARIAAKAYVRVSGLDNLASIPEKTKFIAVNENGIEFNFYTLESIPVIEGITPNPFYVYEATEYVEFDALPNFNYDSQRINIANTNFDLSTLRVTITERLDSDATSESEWTLVNNIGYVSQVDENIYFVERTSTGFSIMFGLKNSLGREIDSNITQIKIRYLKTNGAAGNNLISFRNGSIQGGGNILVDVVSQSSGGRDKPDLDQVRYVAPKWFASQERAVTVNDYKALLIEAGFFRGDTEFNVFGGQDLNPPRFGRVFISSNLNNDDARVNQMIEYLKERSVITILPEYINTDTLNVYTDFSFRLGTNVTNDNANRNTALTTVKSIFASNFAKFREYNVSFSASDFISFLRTYYGTDSAIINNLVISPDDFTNYVLEDLNPNLEYNFNFGNELDVPLAQRIDLTGTFALPESLILNYNLPEGTVGILKIYVQSNSAKNSNVPLELWAVNPETNQQTLLLGQFGTIKVYTGNITIKNNVIASDTTMRVNFKKKNFTIGFNNLVTFNYNFVTVLG